MKKLHQTYVPETTEEQLESDMGSAGSLSGRYQGREEMLELDLLLRHLVFSSYSWRIFQIIFHDALLTTTLGFFTVSLSFLIILGFLLCPPPTNLINVVLFKDWALASTCSAAWKCNELVISCGVGVLPLQTLQMLHYLLYNAGMPAGLNWKGNGEVSLTRQGRWLPFLSFLLLCCSTSHCIKSDPWDRLLVLRPLS